MLFKSNLSNRILILGITGASGALYAVHLIQALARYVQGHTHLIVSPTALRIYNAEYKRKVQTTHEYLKEILAKIPGTKHDFSIEDYHNIGAKPASGSFRFDAVVVVPCSMKSLAGMALGYTTNLVERTADVALKERRPLILMPRETPYSLIHLRNMTSLTEAGAIILPASPGYYQMPETLSDLGLFMAGRVFNLLGIEHSLFREWDPEGEPGS